MPFNLIKSYNELLEITSLGTHNRNLSLKRVFDRDFVENSNIMFYGKQITPTPKDGTVTMDTLFNHLITKRNSRESPNREFDILRSVRLHWIRFHLEHRKTNNVIHFSVKEPEGDRTYIYDIDEKYVIVLEPLRNKQAYYLLSAHKLEGKDSKRDKILRKYKRRLPQLL